MSTAGASAISEYLRVLRRGSWIILITTAAITAIAIALSLAQEKRYESHADVFLSGANSLPLGLAGEQQKAVDPERASNTQANLAKVPEVAELALRSAGLRNRTPGDLLDNSSVSNPPDTDILRFSVTDKSPILATRLATGYASAYSRYRRQLDTASIVNARRQIERRLASLRSSRRTTPGLYRRLTAEDQQLQTAQALQGSNAAVVRQGSEAVQTQPKPVRNGILGGILGLMLGVALVSVREALNTRVRSAEEVEERLGLPLIGRIPQPGRHLRSEGGLAMMVEPHAPGAEAFRILGTNLGFVNLDRGAKSIMITSATEREGKSSTMANVAVALARTGVRVSLIDLDLKRPSLDRLFDLEPGQPGLTGVALGMIELEGALVRIRLMDGHSQADSGSVSPSAGRLHLLPTGPIPPDTARFVASPTVADVIARLSRSSDLVLIDAPPILQASDSMALAGKVDAVVVVVRLAEVRRSALDELRRSLENAPVTKLGFILTGVAATEAYGYGHSSSFNGAPSKAGRREPVR